MKGCAGPLHMRKVKKTRSQPSEQSRAAAPTCAGALLSRGAQGVVNKLRGTGWGAHVVTLWAPSSGRLTGARLSHLRCAYKCRLGTIFSRRTVIAVEGLFWSNVDDDKDEDR